MTATIKLGELAEFLGATLRGSPEKEITGLATLQEAGPAQLTLPPQTPNTVNTWSTARPQPCC